MSLHINSAAPDFTQDSTEGTIHFHEWLGNGWGILFSVLVLWLFLRDLRPTFITLCSIPVSLVFADGSALTNPSAKQVQERLATLAA